ncbi:hypothetical protein MKW94_029421, partial [Papaver nudicaule]|nr:hypothetical protein [Papaver nudicaule]
QVSFPRMETVQLSSQTSTQSLLSGLCLITGITHSHLGQVASFPIVKMLSSIRP